MTPAPAVRCWLLLLAALIALMVVVGGFVRLSRAGLSIVEWDVVTGVVPPLGEAAWQETFDQYLQSPEGAKVNADMSVAEYQRIYLIEWGHRLIARLVGLVLAIPLAFFLWRGIIPWRRSGPYFLVGLGFAFQGFLGWYMVASGLVDRPSVSHLRLTTHLLAALGLLALCLWLALRQVPAGTSESGASSEIGGGGTRDMLATRSSVLRRLGRALMALVVLQVAYGGLVAGLKAGHISNTWPLMLGQWVPKGLLSGSEPGWISLVNAPLTVHFVHRWLAIVVLLLALWLFREARRSSSDPRLARSALWLAVIVLAQVTLGVGVVMMNVPFSLALLHQAMGVAVFALAVYSNIRLSGGEG